MLTTGNALLAVANRHNFAIPAFNISDWAMFQGIVDICEQKAAPLIVAIHPDEVRHIGVDLLPSIRERAHRSSVPIAIHWDHGGTYEQMLVAIQSGFTSVMIDKSMESFEVNVEVTRRVVQTAHAVGLSVEAELGTIGKADNYGEGGANEIIYTDPENAKDFIAQTGVDSLAVAIGTSHGLFPDWKVPELKLDLLKQIKDAVGIPLVLHGGSGNPDDEIAKSVGLGINKINISSDIKVAYHDKIREILADSSLREPNVIQPDAITAMNVVAAHKIDLFDAAGRADLY